MSATRRVAARLPDLFIIGAPKCGTTSLYEYLRGHPQVYMSPRKEPQYFDFDPATAMGMRYGDDLARYLALFEGAGGAPRAGEASTYYLSSTVAPARLAELQPRPYVIASLRDPVEMLHALHGQRLAEGVEPCEDFAAALADEPARLSGDRGAALAAVVYRPRACFAEQLGRWFAAVGRERVHVIIFDDFIARPADEFAELLRFLEVDPGYQPAAFARHNTSHRARSRLFLSLINARGPRHLVRRLVPIGVRNRTTLPVGRRLRALNTRAVPRAALEPAVRDQLRVELADEVARLGGLLGRDLAARWWGQPA